MYWFFGYLPITLCTHRYIVTIIQSLKQQALVACVRAKIEISTLALAIIYFERLCLSCRVDKSNRRLSFAACLLLATKVNESNSVIAYNRGGTQTKSDGSELPSMISWVKPNRKSGKIFDSLIVFFTHDWSLSLKQLYAAEWIVFTVRMVPLSSLTPFAVAFHEIMYPLICSDSILGAGIFSEGQTIRYRIPLQKTTTNARVESSELSWLRIHVRTMAAEFGGRISSK